MKRINPAVGGDEKLDTIIKATITGGEVIPHIHKSEQRKVRKNYKSSISNVRGVLSTTTKLSAEDIVNKVIADLTPTRWSRRPFERPQFNCHHPRPEGILSRAFLSSSGQLRSTLSTRSFVRPIPITSFRGNEKLDTLIKATIAGGEVIPHIHKSLISQSQVSLCH